MPSPSCLAITIWPLPMSLRPYASPFFLLPAYELRELTVHLLDILYIQPHDRHHCNETFHMSGALMLWLIGVLYGPCALNIFWTLQEAKKPKKIYMINLYSTFLTPKLFYLSFHIIKGYNSKTAFRTDCQTRSKKNELQKMEAKIGQHKEKHKWRNQVRRKNQTAKTWSYYSPW